MFIQNVTGLLLGVYVTVGKYGGSPTFITSVHIGPCDVSIYLFNEKKNYLNCSQRRAYQIRPM